jgi:hypothetical protein
MQKRNESQVPYVELELNGSRAVPSRKRLLKI